MGPARGREPEQKAQQDDRCPPHRRRSRRRRRGARVARAALAPGHAVEALLLRNGRPTGLPLAHVVNANGPKNTARLVSLPSRAWRQGLIFGRRVGIGVGGFERGGDQAARAARAAVLAAAAGDDDNDDHVLPLRRASVDGKRRCGGETDTAIINPQAEKVTHPSWGLQVPKGCMKTHLILLISVYTPCQKGANLYHYLSLTWYPHQLCI